MKGQAHRSIDDREFRRDLRKNATDAERRLWQRLRGGQLAGVKFRRQHPFDGYVLDFVSLEKRLIVELDGGQHLDSARDRVRDCRLMSAGFRVLRFWNNDVLEQTDAVVEAIWRKLGESDPSPPLPSP
ncbi:endonuclease domain-containing protein [Georgfuchsia toluolica]|uniref:endonuclease domain-containing protein n=1 Tax=Georgfuchsia toluolica TaxID=424218 RepID=UPI001C734A57|nr:endonuclease domain-containing protein [Georgfuchsia toluolica]